MRFRALWIAGLLALAAGAPLEGSGPRESARAGSIAGLVVDQNGSTFPGASVELWTEEEDAARSTETDEAGRFTFDQVPPGGPHWVLVRSDRFQATSTQVEVVAGETTEVEVQVHTPGQLSVQGLITPEEREQQERRSNLVARVLDIACVSGLLLVLLLLRKRILRSHLLSAAFLVGTVVVVLPWASVVLAFVLGGILGVWEGPTAPLMAFTFYEVPMTLVYGDSWFGKWFLPRDWVGLISLVAFALLVTAGLRVASHWKRRELAGGDQMQGSAEDRKVDRVGGKLKRVLAIVVALVVAGSLGFAWFVDLYVTQVRNGEHTKTVTKRIRAFHDQTGEYPASLELIYDRAPKDLWGHPYHYEFDGVGYLLVSMGRDGELDDIDYWGIVDTLLENRAQWAEDGLVRPIYAWELGHDVDICLEFDRDHVLTEFTVIQSCYLK